MTVSCFVMSLNLFLSFSFFSLTHTHTPSRMHMYRLVDAVTRSAAGGCLFIHLHVGSQQDGLITSRGQ